MGKHYGCLGEQPWVPMTKNEWVSQKLGIFKSCGITLHGNRITETLGINIITLQVLSQGWSRAKANWTSIVGYIG